MCRVWNLWIASRPFLRPMSLTVSVMGIEATAGSDREGFAFHPGGFAGRNRARDRGLVSLANLRRPAKSRSLTGRRAS